MRADERHKLRTNQLADYLQRAPELVKQHAKLLVGLAVLIVLVVAVVFYVGYQREARTNKAWNDFNAAQNKLFDALATGKSSELGKAAEEFGRVASDYANTPPVTSWALYYQGHMLLLQARQRAIDSARSGAARDLLSRAEEALKLVVEREKYHPIATPTAWLDLAGIYADRAEFGKARDALLKVNNDKMADPGLAAIADLRLSDLTEASRITFATWTAPPTTSAETPIPGLGDEPFKIDMPPLPAPSASAKPMTQKDSR
ncbi:MAG: hypothetical protein PHU85_03290 [Phycisphaerae bacterium]|nr:hypothetical protein [Phycisphaerae bacterium]